jgi:hypothetical protein
MSAASNLSTLTFFGFGPMAFPVDLFPGAVLLHF